MQSRRSGDPSRQSLNSHLGDREGLIRAYDEEEAAGFGLTDLADDSDVDSDDLHRSNGGANGKQHYSNSIELENRKSSDR